MKVRRWSAGAAIRVDVRDAEDTPERSARPMIMLRADERGGSARLQQPDSCERGSGEDDRLRHMLMAPN